MTLDGLVIAGIGFAATLLVISVGALVLVALKIQEERAGTGCRSAGCRRSRAGDGFISSRVAEPARDINWRE